jgi:hypothetical protein
VFGFFETMIEYFLPGINASLLTDKQMAIKLGHLHRIRKMEGNEDEVMKKLLNILKL